VQKNHLVLCEQDAEDAMRSRSNPPKLAFDSPERRTLRIQASGGDFREENRQPGLFRPR
jgi:hypothetical protein